MQETQDKRVQSLDQEDSLGWEMATYFSILAWKILRIGEPGVLQSTVSQSLTRLSTQACVLRQHQLTFLKF